MEFVDKDLKCSQCGAAFVFLADEQVFFESKGFQNIPRLCRQCRAKKTSQKPVRYEVEAVCAGCGSKTTVPFKPFRGNPVYCRACYQKRMAMKTA
jgi:CxxC-x17-CxxC domain-containing protein